MVGAPQITADRRHRRPIFGMVMSEDSNSFSVSEMGGICQPGPGGMLQASGSRLMSNEGYCDEFFHDRTPNVSTRFTVPLDGYIPVPSGMAHASSMHAVSGMECHFEFSPGNATNVSASYLASERFSYDLSGVGYSSSGCPVFESDEHHSRCVHRSGGVSRD